MCSCDKEHGERFLPHQLKTGSWKGTNERVPVTLGFQDKVCPVCRGQKAEVAPKASMHGATTKVVRYYWREIFFETTRRFYNAHPELDPLDHNSSEFNFPEERRAIEKQVISEVKKQHEINPKYEYSEITQQEVIETTNTEVILVNAEHVSTGEKKVGIRSVDGILTVEKFAAAYFNKQGFNVLEVESVPFHVLFGVLMYLVIEDPDDSKGRIVQFGSRNDFDTNTREEGLITTILPDDFGSDLYYERQKKLIDWHISELQDLNWLFDYWLEYSSNLRQYLWAHREKDISTAKEVMAVLGVENIKKVLNYLAMNYWRNFCGWPDLLVFNDESFFFVEVKSSNDKLSEDQKNWLLGNMQHMGFKTKIFKVGKLNV
jgi:Holliday junction resolvase-like predicted endonuclease